MSYYRIGKILNTHGLKGDLKVQVITDFDRFEKGSTVYLLYKDEYKTLKVCKKSEYAPHILVRFENHEDINLVEKWKGSELFITEAEQEALPDGEYYYHQLIGLEVINENGDHRGVVHQIREVPQGNLLVVKKPDGKNALIPFRDEFIKKVSQFRIIVKEIEGLF